MVFVSTQRPESLIKDMFHHLTLVAMLGWMQGAWLVAGVILPLWGDVTMAVIAWVAGANAVLERHSNPDEKTNSNIQWFLQLAGSWTLFLTTPVLLVYTEYFLVEHWDPVLEAFGSRSAAALCCEEEAW